MYICGGYTIQKCVVYAPIIIAYKLVVIQGTYTTQWYNYTAHVQSYVTIYIIYIAIYHLYSDEHSRLLHGHCSVPAIPSEMAPG